MKSKWPFLIVIVFFLGYLGLEFFGPQPEDWSPSFELEDETPLGSKLLFESLGDIFPDQEIQVTREPANKALNEFSSEKSNLIIIENEFNPNLTETKALLKYVRSGNTAFIAAHQFTGALSDTLNIWNTKYFLTFFDHYAENANKDYLVLDEKIDPEQKHYYLLENLQYKYIPYYDQEEDGEVLSENKDGHPTFVKIREGKGTFYIHSIPAMFTNLSMVHETNYEYVSRTLSVLPVQKTYWDEYYKPDTIKNLSAFSYVMEARSLWWALMVALSGVFLYVIFEAKRKQRVIPEISEPANTSLEFTRTVGLLYYRHGDHKDICEKKIKFLLEHIRNRWMLPTNDFSEEFIRKLSAKSGVAAKELHELFSLCVSIRNAPAVGEISLKLLNGKIEEFYALSK